MLILFGVLRGGEGRGVDRGGWMLFDGDEEWGNGDGEREEMSE